MKLMWNLCRHEYADTQTYGYVYLWNLDNRKNMIPPLCSKITIQRSFKRNKNLITINGRFANYYKLWISQFMFYKFIFHYCLSQVTFPISWHIIFDYSLYKCDFFHSCCWLLALSAKFPNLPLYFEGVYLSGQTDQQALQCLSPFCFLSSMSTLPVFNLHLSDSQCVGYISKAAEQLGWLLKFRFLESTLKKRWFDGSDLAFL